jgi:hypothetical protein
MLSPVIAPLYPQMRRGLNDLIWWYYFEYRVEGTNFSPEESLAMLRLGICTQDQYVRTGKQRRLSGSRVAYSLLSIGENPTTEQIQIFEDINFTLRTSNGTSRTTFRNRLRDVDAATIGILERLYPSDYELLAEDRAASHGLTSLELAGQLFEAFHNSRFEASDRLLYLIQLSLVTGERYILEPKGQLLQYIKPPFVVSLAHQESLRFPINRLIAARARRRFRHLSLPAGWTESIGGDGYKVSQINCVHPEVLSFSSTNPRFQLHSRSVFDITPDAVHVLRTMNILNKDYFSESQLRKGSEVAFRSLKLGGVWIVGRTLESDFSNHVTFLQKLQNGWGIITRIGNGSEMEAYAGLDLCLPAAR